MAFVNLPPNLQDMFNNLGDRVAKLETGPSQAMYTADAAQTTAVSAQGVSSQALTAANLANTQATTAIALANTKNTVFYSGSAPTANAVNDQWINTAAGNKLYIWNGSSWVSAQDTAIAAAQTTADGKNKIYRQGTTPTGSFSVGDLWFNTSSDNQMSRWDGSSWVSTTLGTNALANFSANKITSGTIDASVVNVSNINAGNISTGYLAASRIQTGSLNANVITSNTITATQIAAGTITATEISSSYVYAGTISANNITTGTLSATVSLSAVSGTIGGWTLNSTQLYSGTGAFMDASTGNIGGNAITAFSSILSYGSISTTSGAAIESAGLMRANGQLYAAGHTTTGSAANGYVNASTGLIARSTASSQRYKHDIVNLTDVPELDPTALYELPVRAFRFNKDYLPETDDRADALVPGFIAEEVDAIYPAGVDYNAGQAETWNDRMLVPAMLSLIQDLNNRIKQVEGK